MAELTHLYDETSTRTSTSSTTYVDSPSGGADPVILGSALTADTNYLIVARGLIESNNVSDHVYFRVFTADDTTIETKSEVRYEMADNSSDAGISYFFVHSFKTHVTTPTDVKLQFKSDGSPASARWDQATLWLLDLDAIGTAGTDYFEDINNNTEDVDDIEYEVTPTTTTLATIAGSDMGTDEHLILGYARVAIGSAGRWFAHSLNFAYDTATSASSIGHAGEGEDVAEMRVSGFFARHKASSGTPDVTLTGSEEAANGNMHDEGAYLIALPTALFADFVEIFTTGDVDVNTEATVATTGSYTPTTAGNHLIFGRVRNNTNFINDNDNAGQIWVDSTSTEIRTGDALPTHWQSWDKNKTSAQMITFQRYSISTAETFNLQAVGHSADPSNVDERILIVVNLNAADGGQTISPGLASELVNAFDPVVTTGPVSMTPGLQQQLAQAFDPTLTTTVTFTPALEQQLAQAFDPTITPGPVSMTPGLLQRLAQAFDPTLTTTVEIIPALFQELVNAFDPAITTGPVTITPALLQQLAQGIDPAITLFEQTLTPGLLQRLAQGFDPVVTTGAVTIAPGLLQQLVQAFTTTVTPGPATLAPDLAQQLTQAFAPILSAEYFITPALKQQLVLTFDPTIDPGAVTILPALIQELVNTFDPTLTTVVTVSPGLANQSAVAYDPIVTFADAQTIEPGLFQQVTISFDPVVSPGAVTISVDLVQQLVQTYGPIVSGDGQEDALMAMGDWSD